MKAYLLGVNDNNVVQEDNAALFKYKIRYDLIFNCYLNSDGNVKNGEKIDIIDKYLRFVRFSALLNIYLIYCDFIKNLDNNGKIKFECFHNEDYRISESEYKEYLNKIGIKNSFLFHVNTKNIKGLFLLFNHSFFEEYYFSGNSICGDFQKKFKKYGFSFMRHLDWEIVRFVKEKNEFYGYFLDMLYTSLYKVIFNDTFVIENEGGFKLSRAQN